MSHTYYYIPQGVLGQNNHFDSLVNVLDNSPQGNTLYDNMLIWASPSEMSQLRLERRLLPLYSVFPWCAGKQNGISVLTWQSEEALSKYVNIYTDLIGLLHLGIDKKRRCNCVKRSLCLTFCHCCLRSAFPSVAQAAGFVSEGLYKRSAGRSLWRPTSVSMC